MEIFFCRGMRFASTLRFSPLSTTNNFLEATHFIKYNDTRRWRFKLFEKCPHYRNLSCNYVPFINRIKTQMPLTHKFNKNLLVARCCNTTGKGDVPKTEPVEKQSIFARMKQLTKDYWHILIPVHIVTSLGWVAVLYTAVSNGADTSRIMELLHVSQEYVEMVENTGAGDWALTYIFYKIFTPLRYTVTVGCTTMAIKRLAKSGHIKAPSFGKQSKEIYKATESSKTGTHKAEYKVERQTEPPKT